MLYPSRDWGSGQLRGEGCVQATQCYEAVGEYYYVYAARRQ